VAPARFHAPALALPQHHTTDGVAVQAFQARYEVHRVGGHVHDEYWIPAEDRDELNRNIVGPIEVIAEYAGGPDHEPRQMR
jgi:hypothetical protein